ncbi:MAG: hypothetical protein A2X77_03150 [Gammaproteobacteria bacterium GWE2_42_36]|nr:MAG: hypothetical protein A2X77_03150 [Gammaproteobacteria bacterium GWE2_42_36]HCU04830.1 hypothetical protein [Coxiellaceae bacterium]
MSGAIEFDLDNLKNVFRETGLHNPRGEFYSARKHKHKQVFDYIIQLESAFKKLSTKRPIVMVDCGCGKSYLSFILYEYCRSVLKRDIKIIGIDNNATLIEKCRAIAQALGFEQMEFFDASVGEFKSKDPVDIVYSLHACNTATDQTIAQGIQLGAKYIFSVSCCQHRNRQLIKNHPLTALTRFQPYKERIVDMVGDSLRALLLEEQGYGVNLFEFTSAEQTPKNIMLRGIKNKVKKIDKESAHASYQQLVELFNFSPALEEYLQDALTAKTATPINLSSG